MVDFVIFDRIRAYDKVWVRQLLDKFAQAMGVTIDVETSFLSEWPGHPDAFIDGLLPLYLAQSFNKNGYFSGYKLFAKEMIGGTNTSVWQRAEMTTTYPPYTLSSESTIKGPDNMALLRDGGNSEVETASIAPLEGSELKAAAEYLRRKYRIWKRINNRFLLFATYSDNPERTVMMLFDRQRADKLRKVVVHRRNAHGKMTDVTYYYMEPVLCQEKCWWHAPDYPYWCHWFMTERQEERHERRWLRDTYKLNAPSNVVDDSKFGVWGGYIEQLHDDKDYDRLNKHRSKYRRRIRTISRYHQEYYTDGMMVWLRVKL